MLVKQIKGCDFYGCLAYVLGKDGARSLDSTMTGTEPNDLNQAFQELEQLRSPVHRRVYHCALNLPIGEHLSDHAWREFSKDFLKQMGFQGHQYVLVQHSDRDHEHCHIIANRVGLDGAVVSDAWDYGRAEAIVRQLELDYGLQSLKPSWATERKALSRRQLEEEFKTGKPCVQRQLQEGIDAVLEESDSLEDLTAQLADRDIQTQVTYGFDDRAIGISYGRSGVMMSGSNLGKRYTLAALKQRWPDGEHQHVPGVKQMMKAAIAQASQDQPTLSELIERLDERGIAVHLRFGKLRHEKGKIKAMSFSRGGVSYLGQSLGEAYHLAGLQQYFGIDYDPQRDNAWFKIWRSRVKAPKTALKTAFVLFPQQHFKQVSRNQAIAQLEQMSRKTLGQAKEKGFERLQFVTSAAPGIEQWGTVVALKLREEQRQGLIDSVPAIAVVVLTQQNLAEPWSKTQQKQYAKLLAAVDRVDGQSSKADYLNENTIVLGNIARHKSQELII